jgi:hypothetical protein
VRGLSSPTEKPIPSAGAWKKWLDVTIFGHSLFRGMFINIFTKFNKEKIMMQILSSN